MGLIPAHAGKTCRRGFRLRRVRAHPRSRGENPSVGHDGRNLEGLIPAHAGKTGGGPRRGRGAWAHPRSRGENEKAGIPASLGSGSSPLTRGKRSGNGCNGRKRGLIPAHAGKTAPSMSSPWAGWAHPRSRGENRAFDVLAVGRMGSSPLTRGKRTGMITSSDAARLIPAHAGKTRSSRGPQGSCWAHPRSRGENLEDNWEVLEADGSSPLTRGKRPVSDGLRVGGGLIPAHAGKTRPSSGWTSWRAAHPRSRGENLVAR